MVNALGIAAVVLVIIIVYFFIRLRQQLKSAPGATSKMNTIQLIKNWQDQKAAESKYQSDLKEYARQQAEPEIAKVMVDRYKQEAIKEATTDKGTQFKEKMRQGLGIDIDKAMSKENVERMVGRTGNVNVDQGKTDIFNQERLQRMSQTGAINQDRIRQASGDLQWGEGMRRGLQSNSRFEGVERAIRRDSQQYQPPQQPQPQQPFQRRRFGPPPRP